MTNLTVVLVEDDQKIADIQVRFLEKIPQFELVGVANTLAEAKQIIDVFQPDLVLLDIYFPDGNGIDLLWDIRQNHKKTDVICITSAKEIETLQDAVRGGVFDYILKPMTFGRLQSTMTAFYDHRAKLLECTELNQNNVDNIIHPNAEKKVDTDRLPKGIDLLTLEKIEHEVKSLHSEGINAEDMGLRVGIGRTTARRYLEFLVSKGTVKPNLTYGSVGRPERLYFKNI